MAFKVFPQQHIGVGRGHGAWEMACLPAVDLCKDEEISLNLVLLTRMKYGGRRSTFGPVTAHSASSSESTSLAHQWPGRARDMSAVQRVQEVLSCTAENAGPAGV
jgi:hypothetical protein